MIILDYHFTKIKNLKRFKNYFPLKNELAFKISLMELKRMEENQCRVVELEDFSLERPLFGEHKMP